MNDHRCDFNTAGYCPGCGARVALPRPSTTAPEIVFVAPPPLAFPGTTALPTLSEEILRAEGDPSYVCTCSGGGNRAMCPRHCAISPEDGEPIVVRVNGGSPVGPGFVVYERAPGMFGYDVKMAKGSIGPGWRHLVQALFDHVEHDKKWNPRSGFAHLVVTQVKEKFGDLRIYFSTTGTGQGGYDRVEGFVDALTAISRVTCEACGHQGKTRGERGWVLTLCDACDAKDRGELRALFEQTEQTE